MSELERLASQEPVYITGHRHPDTDSVVSAIAYAFFKRALGIRAVPCRLGPLGNETKYLLERFGFEEPAFLADARKTLKAKKGNMDLVNVGPNFLRVLKMTGMIDLFDPKTR